MTRAGPGKASATSSPTSPYDLMGHLYGQAHGHGHGHGHGYGLRARWARSRLVWAVATVCALMAFSLVLWTEAIEGGRLMDRIGVSRYGFGGTGSLGEPISIVLIAGRNAASAQEVVEALLAHTVGPYELICVYNRPDNTEPLISSTIHSYLRTGRSHFTRHTTISASAHGLSPAQARLAGLKKARYPRVAVLGASDKMTTFGWDRVLLAGLGASEGLLGVSGRAAADVAHVDESTAARLVEPLGEPTAESHLADVSGPEVALRHVAMRAPMLYDVRKMRRVGYATERVEQLGMGDLDMCLRARRDHGWACGYYPVSVETRTEWAVVGGTPRFGLELQLSRDDVAALRLDEHVLGDHQYRSVRAVDRQMGDIPQTIVTATTAATLPHLLGLHATLDWSPYTRFIVYLVRTAEPICLAELHALPGVEVRYLPSGPKHVRHPHAPRTPEPAVRARNEAGSDGDGDGEGDGLNVSVEVAAARWTALQQLMSEVGGLVLWVDPDRVLDSGIGRVWGEMARDGFWAGRPGLGLSSSSSPSSAPEPDTVTGTNTNIDTVTNIDTEADIAVGQDVVVAAPHAPAHARRGTESAFGDGCDIGVVGVNTLHPIDVKAVVDLLAKGERSNEDRGQGGIAAALRAAKLHCDRQSLGVQREGQGQRLKDKDKRPVCVGKTY